MSVSPVPEETDTGETWVLFYGYIKEALHSYLAVDGLFILEVLIHNFISNSINLYEKIHSCQ